jgi:hypothetical protein
VAGFVIGVFSCDVFRRLFFSVAERGLHMSYQAKELVVMVFLIALLIVLFLINGG